MSQQIGQLRFQNKAQCVADISTTQTLTGTTTSQTGQEESTSFKDLLITPAGGSFSTDTDYYLHIAIPQDINYTSTFNIKLVKGQGSQSYQFLKQVTITRGGSGDFVHDVALYEDNDHKVRAMIPLQYQDGITTEKNALYVRILNGTSRDRQFYLGTGLKAYNSTDHVNMVQVAESWRMESTDNFGTFDVVFRPVETDFTGILVEMQRSTEDYAIQTTVTAQDGTTTIQYGRTLDTSKVQVTLQSMRNLVGNLGTLERIGVWGHPGTIMAVNSEFICIGPSGYYEEDVVPITSLGIVATSYKDNFTVDYVTDGSDTEGGK